jgi:hypothetical protein
VLKRFYLCIIQKLEMMSKSNINPRLIAIISIIAFGAFMRLIPHWPNFTPIAAMALFGGAYLSRKHLAFVIPFGAMIIADLVIGFHGSMWAVYTGFASTILIGFRLARKVTFGNVLIAALASSIIFFLITNFASWLAYDIYPKNFFGLMQSYIAGLACFNDGKLGISFFLNEVLGTLVYSLAFFGVFSMASRRIPALRAA